MTHASGAADPGLVVAVAHHPSDTGRAAALTAFLRGAQVTVTTSPGAGPDGVVVLLSAVALAEPGWLEQADLRGRVVPVRIGPIDGLPVPRGLSDLNYLDWPVEQSAAFFGRVLAALVTDPVRRDFLRQVTREAQAWLDAGQPSQLLLHDRRRGRQAVDAVRDAAADPAAVLPPVTAAFIGHSDVALRRHHALRRVQGVFLLVTVLVLAGVAWRQVPRILLGGNNNRSAISTAGDPDILAAMPEWTAVNSAALLVNGSAEQRRLARASLLAAMGRPWRVSALQSFRTVNTADLFDRGRQAVVTFEGRGRTHLAVVDVRTAETTWHIALPGRYHYVSVTPEGNAAVVSGASGVIGVDLRTRTARPLLTGEYVGNAPAGTGRAAVLDGDGSGHRVSLVDTGTGAVVRSGRYLSVLALRTAGPSAVALVQPSGGRLRLVDTVSGRTLAETGEVPYADGTGGVAPDGRHAVVEGDDGQVWTFGSGSPAEPTGIPVRLGHAALLWATGDRIVVSSSDYPAEVYQRSPAVRLGTMCVHGNRPAEIRPGAGTDTVTCVTETGVSFYDLPTGLGPPAPACAGCQTDTGLLAAFRARLTGCLTATQVGWIDEKTRRDLGVRTCAEPIGGE